MEGRLLGPDGKTGMAGIKMFVYHADRDGEYARGSERYMRLAGVLSTDANGRYRLVSTLPGQYAGPPHVHFEAWGPGLPLRLWFVNLYRGSKGKPDSLWGRMDVRDGPPPHQSARSRRRARRTRRLLRALRFVLGTRLQSLGRERFDASWTRHALSISHLWKLASPTGAVTNRLLDRLREWDALRQVLAA